MLEWCVDNGTGAVETSREYGAFDDFEPVAMGDTDNYSSQTLLISESIVITPVSVAATLSDPHDVQYPF